ncbi:TPA: hypothetical protein DF272_04650 [Candidatus Falkowbacteria bacterium]|nr:hypothetical protein [Candidatus Falkowbacteria bacterium]
MDNEIKGNVLAPLKQEKRVDENEIVELGADELGKNEQTKQISLAWELLVDQMPELKDVKLRILKKRQIKDVRFTRGTYIFPVKEEDPLEIQLLLSNDDVLDLMDEEERAVVRQHAKKIGLKDEQLEGALLRVFIFAHEAGHVVDFVKNYLNNFDYQGMARSEVVEIWREEYRANMNMLAVPNMTRPKFEAFLAAATEVEVDEFLDNYGFDSIKEFKMEQQKSYRQLPHESYADDFAIKFIKKNAAKFGLVFAE